MEHRTTEVLQEIKADTQFAKLFVEQLGRNSVKAKWNMALTVIILVTVGNLISYWWRKC